MVEKMIYAGIGLVLFVAAVITDSYGLSEENKKVYSEALKLQDKMKTKGFKNFSLEDYPVRFYDGDFDYVVSTTNGKQEIDREKPVLPTFVGTAYEVEGTYEIIVPTVEKFRKIDSIFSAASSLQEEELQFNTRDYGVEEHASTVWHEGFHAYQNTYFSESAKKWQNQIAEHGIVIEQLITTEVDGNEEVKQIMKKELQILKEAVLTENLDEVKGKLLEYKELEQQRQENLSEQARFAEAYLETFEGTARYFESEAYKIQYGEKKWKEHYLKHAEQYIKGNGKYYTSGMMKAYLLDKIDSGWKESFDFSESMSTVFSK